MFSGGLSAHGCSSGGHRLLPPELGVHPSFYPARSPAQKAVVSLPRAREAALVAHRLLPDKQQTFASHSSGAREAQVKGLTGLVSRLTRFLAHRWCLPHMADGAMEL